MWSGTKIQMSVCDILISNCRVMLATLAAAVAYITG